MSVRQHLISLIETFGKAKGISPSRVTTLAMNSGHIYARLVEGGNITIDRLEAAVSWFSDNWPEGTDWPEGIARPEKEAA